MKNIAIVLSGGMGERMGTGVPKQYLNVAGKPIVVHTLEQFQHCGMVDGTIVVAGSVWEPRILQWKKDHLLTKLLAIAPAGENRQISILNGLTAAEKFMDSDDSSGIIVQDAARPLTSQNLLTNLLCGLEDAACVMPALPVTDTTYTSSDGQWVDGLLDRKTLYAGQAPEAFRYWPYFALYLDASKDLLSTMSGSCQLPYITGWQVKMIPGEVENIKVTYPNDLEFCEKILRERRHESVCPARN